MDLPLEKSSSTNASKPLPCRTVSTRVLQNATTEFSDPVLAKDLFADPQKTKNQKQPHCPHCKKSSTIKHLPSSSPLFPRCALACVHQRRADRQMEILCMKGTRHPVRLPAGKWSLLHSLPLLTEIYWNIFFRAKYLKILPPAHPTSVIYRKSIELKGFLRLLWSKHRTVKNTWILLVLGLYTHISQRNLNLKFWIWLEQLKNR